MRTLASLLLLAGCGSGSPPPATAPASIAPASAAAPETAAPETAAPETAAPVTEPPAPAYTCTIFVLGDPETAFSATIEDKQFKQKETTSTEIRMYTKVLRGDAAKRTALCDAFAKRKCPEPWRGDGGHCRMQETTDAEADWGAATPVPQD